MSDACLFIGLKLRVQSEYRNSSQEDGPTATENLTTCFLVVVCMRNGFKCHFEAVLYAGLLLFYHSVQFKCLF